MNGHVGQTKKLSKVVQSKPDQHVGMVCWTTCPVYTGLKERGLFLDYKMTIS